MTSENPNQQSSALETGKALHPSQARVDKLSTIHHPASTGRNRHPPSTARERVKSLGCRNLSALKSTPCSIDRKSTRLNSSHRCISYAVFCLKKKNTRTRLPALQWNALYILT